MNSTIAYKIDRFCQGEKLRVLDLFSGCGGFSLGFLSAGFQIVGALEKDPTAANTHAINFFPPDEGASHAQARDAVETEPAELANVLGLGMPERAIDVILAGPPCQSYARVGRAKLREILGDKDAYLYDRRGKLYERLLHYVSALKPLVVVFENVLDVLNQAGENVVEHICETLDMLGYTSRYTTLNAAHYGVPQMRERVFIVSYLSELGITPSFPEPSHWIELPNGYNAARDIALRSLGERTAGESPSSSYYLPSPEPLRALPAAVSVRKAISDLPVIDDEMKAAIRLGPRRFNQAYSYRRGRPSDYAHQMRHWEGFETYGVIYDHVIRRLPRDYPIFARMGPGDQYPEAHRIALKELWPARMKALGLTGPDAIPENPNYERYQEEKSKVVPPYDPDKFVDKWRKMDPDEPARTLTAHLGKDSYTHIHYDDAQARTISVREAARLQSFPDGFVFSGAMNAAFRQIGNAVPPLLAKAIAVQIQQQLQIAVGAETRAGTKGHVCIPETFEQEGDGQAWQKPSVEVVILD